MEIQSAAAAAEDRAHQEAPANLETPLEEAALNSSGVGLMPPTGMSPVWVLQVPCLRTASAVGFHKLNTLCKQH